MSLLVLGFFSIMRFLSVLPDIYIPNEISTPLLGSIKTNINSSSCFTGLKKLEFTFILWPSIIALSSSNTLNTHNY